MEILKDISLPDKSIGARLLGGGGPWACLELGVRLH